MLTKKCSKCNQELLFDCFTKQSSTKSGLSSRCKTCQAKDRELQDKKTQAEYKKKYYADNIETIKTKKAQYAIDKKDKIRNYQKKYRVENKDKISHLQKEYTDKNKEKIKNYQKEFYLENKEKIKQYKKDYYLKNYQYCSIKSKQYYHENKNKISYYFKQWSKSPFGISSIRNATHKKRFKNKSLLKATSVEIYELLLSSSCCHWCGIEFSNEVAKTIDHYIPISKGGEHSIENMVISCLECNMRKYNKLPHEFLAKMEIEQ